MEWNRLAEAEDRADHEDTQRSETRKTVPKWCGQRPEKLFQVMWPETRKTVPKRWQKTRKNLSSSDVARDQKNFVLVMANGQWKNCALVEEKQVS